MASGRSSKAVHSEVEDEDDRSSLGQYANVRSSELRVRGFVLIGGRPCRILEMSSSKTGKHGSCKIHLVAVDAFTGRKRVTAHTSSEVVQVPLVVKRECRLVRIDADADCDFGDDQAVAREVRLQVEDKSGATLAVRLCPDKAAELLTAARQQRGTRDGDGDVIVTVMTAMGEEAAVAVRRAKDRSG